MPKPDPTSFRLSHAGKAALEECMQLSGLTRTSVAEMAIREYLTKLRKLSQPVKKNQEKILVDA
jgi:hypothetical protein